MTWNKTLTFPFSSNWQWLNSFTLSLSLSLSLYIYIHVFFFSLLFKKDQNLNHRIFFIFLFKPPIRVPYTNWIGLLPFLLVGPYSIKIVKSL